MREREPDPESGYERLNRKLAEFVDRQHQGKVVIWPQDRQAERARQGFVTYYLNEMHEDSCLQEWLALTQDIPERSGKHRHQGGLVIMALEGRGRTVIEGEAFDWEEGDLVALPLRKRGVVHQHFNLEPDKPARWLAFMHHTLWDYVGCDLEQIELAPSFTDGD